MERKALLVVFLLFFASFAAKCYYLDKTPFLEDETLYAEMIAEEAAHLSIIPTYFGYPAPWKPGLYFISYSFFIQITSQVFDSLEWAYRSPNLLFSLISTCLVFLIAKRFLDTDAAIISALLFFSSITSLYVETRLLMEPMTLAIILASLFFYTKKKKTNGDFLAGGALALIAALTKSVISLSIPLLVLVYIFTREKKSLRNPVFLVSLLGSPLGLLLFFLSLAPIGFAEDIFLLDTGQAVLYDYSDALGFTLRNISNVFSFLFLFLVAILAFVFRKQKAEPMLIAWTLLLLIPLVASTFRSWYLYYFIPPLAIFAASAMLEKRKADSFSLILVSLFVLMGIGIFAASFSDWDSGTYLMVNEAKNIGISLAGQNSTLFVGSYYYNTVAICYKALEERREFGAPLDFGYILVRNPYQIDDFDSYAQDFLLNYRTEKYELEDERFAQFFWNDTSFRKDTEIDGFNTLVASPPLSGVPPGYGVEYSGEYAEVYSKN